MIVTPWLGGSAWVKAKGTSRRERADNNVFHTERRGKHLFALRVSDRQADAAAAALREVGRVHMTWREADGRGNQPAAALEYLLWAESERGLAETRA